MNVKFKKKKKKSQLNIVTEPGLLFRTLFGVKHK